MTTAACGRPCENKEFRSRTYRSSQSLTTINKHKYTPKSNANNSNSSGEPNGTPALHALVQLTPTTTKTLEWRRWLSALGCCVFLNLFTESTFHLRLCLCRVVVCRSSRRGVAVGPPTAFPRYGSPPLPVYRGCPAWTHGGVRESRMTL